jgi:hypothetical protein
MVDDGRAEATISEITPVRRIKPPLYTAATIDYNVHE